MPPRPPKPQTHTYSVILRPKKGATETEQVKVRAHNCFVSHRGDLTFHLPTSNHPAIAGFCCGSWLSFARIEEPA